MDAFKEDIEVGSSVESFLGFLNVQRELFHSQVDQLQRVVVAQCQLTGVNPLAQEMAAGALSIKIEKKPRDLLNPKAIKYMQAVFSIKDAIGKKETREISALFGITVRQVRDYFVSQKSRVRKQVRLSREKSISFSASHGKDQIAMISAYTERPYGVLNCQNDILPLDPVPLDSAPAASAMEVVLNPVPLISLGPTTMGEASSASSQDDIPPGISDSDRHFAENIFPMMRREETFSGQVKLIEWILQIQDSSVLIWFLIKGGVMVLTTWLNQAATEEQTSVLLMILKVLCHLPLHKASPETMSAILQSVSRLRFYRISDVSNRARALLSKWTKLFAKIQAMKKPNGLRSNADAHSQMLLKQSIVEIMGADGNPEELLGPTSEGLENIRRLEYSQAPKLLLAAGDDSAKKQMLGPSSSYNRERRKVQLVEQPGEKASGRNAHNSRTVSVNQSRPLSADDIQKAKMRALFMQSKYGKKDSSSNAISVAKSGGLDKPPSVQPVKDLLSSVSSEVKTGKVVEPLGVQPNTLVPSSIVNLRLKTEERNKLPAVLSKTYHKLGVSHDSRRKMNPQIIFTNCKRIQIAWLMPPEIKINEIWRLAAGESSKEVDVQRNRNRREKETTYRSLQEIPLNPKEPWDREMDYDDTLTPEIPIEQPPDTEATEPNSTEQHGSLTESLSAAIASASSTANVKSGGTPEPDLELLAVLLKNPELVFALTSSKAGSSTNQETVKLLDMIKTGGTGLAGPANGGGPVRVEEKVEVSLPSPTPSSNPGTSGWRPEVAKNPFSKQPVPQVAAASTQYQQPTTMAPVMHHQAQASLPSTRIQPQLQQTNNHHHHHLLQQPVLSNLSNSSVHAPVYFNRDPTQNTGATTTSDVWRTQQRNNASYYSHQPDHNIRSNASSYQPRAYLQHPANPGFESWSPDNSPSRNTGAPPAYGGDWARQQNSRGYWDRNGRWHDQRR